MDNWDIADITIVCLLFLLFFAAYASSKQIQFLRDIFTYDSFEVKRPSELKKSSLK